MVRTLHPQWVFRGIYIETKEVFMTAVQNHPAATLLPIINKCIRSGSTIYSDHWSAYRDIEQLGEHDQPSFDHWTVNRSQQFVDPLTRAHTQHVECLWRSVKESNNSQRGTDHEMLSGYLSEFLWCHSLKDRKPLDAILQDMADFYPPID